MRKGSLQTLGEGSSHRVAECEHVAERVASSRVKVVEVSRFTEPNPPSDKEN